MHQQPAEVASQKRESSILETHLNALLQLEQVTGEALDSIQWLYDAIHKYPTPEAAVTAINALLDTHVREHHLPHDNVTLQMLEELFKKLPSTMQKQAAHAGMIYGRTRDMEHGGRGTLRKDFGYALEWLVTLAAIIWAGYFWRIALSNLEGTAEMEERGTMQQ